MRPSDRGLPHALRHAIRLVVEAIAFLVSLTVIVTTGCTPEASNTVPPILLFNGTGASANSVAAIEAILKDCHLEYAVVDSDHLNAMSESRLKAYRLFIVPGGNYIAMGDSLTASATANIRTAVEDGLNYLGICAGGFLAGNATCNSLDLMSGVRFDFYSVVNQGIHKEVAPITCVGSPTIEHYWEDGPQFTGWGDVVGKYPDGTPAIVEGMIDQGWVVLCGVHPEAPASWRRGMSFSTPASVDNAYARTLIDAALNRRILPHF